MELASNLVWLLVTLSIVMVTLRGLRRGRVRLSRRSALLLAGLLCLILLPVISLTDDLLEARQAALPLSAQTWRMACEGGSLAPEMLPLLGACLLLMSCFSVEFPAGNEPDDHLLPLATWLMRSQRLRPPPVPAS